MKKVLVLFLSFFILSCSEGKVFKDPEKVAGGQVVSSELQDCIAKSPISDKEHSYFFSFKNKSENLCYYLGITNNQFFLVSENLEKNISKNLKNDLETGYFIKNDGESEEEFFKHILIIFSHTKYNLLYTEKDIKNLFEKIYKTKYLEIPMFALFDEKNILDRYLEKFKELNITLPEKYFSKGELKLNLPNNTPEYLKNLNIENLYQTLLDLQKNS